MRSLLVLFLLSVSFCDKVIVPVKKGLDDCRQRLILGFDTILCDLATAEELEKTSSITCLAEFRKALFESISRRDGMELFDSFTDYLLEEEGLVFEGNEIYSFDGTFDEYMYSIRSRCVPILVILEDSLPDRVYDIIKMRSLPELVDLYDRVVESDFERFMVSLELLDEDLFDLLDGETHDEAVDIFWGYLKDNMDSFLWELLRKIDADVYDLYLGWLTVDRKGYEIDNYFFESLLHRKSVQLILSNLAYLLAEEMGREYFEVRFKLIPVPHPNYQAIVNLVCRYLDSPNPNEFSDPLIDGSISIAEFGRILSTGKLADKYSISAHEIGKGSWGTVTMGSYGAQLVAIKELPNSLAKFSDIKNEVCLLQSISHPNVIKLLDTYWEGDKIFLVMEHGGNTLREQFYKKNTRSIPILKSIAQQILEGLKYLHSRNIVHRDIKMSNVVIDNEDRVRIVDLGLAQELQSPDEVIRTRCGTYRYYAPELAQNQPNSFPADIWALGVILWELTESKGLMKGETKEDTIKKIAEIQEIQFHSKAWKNETLKDFVSKCLTIDPKARPTAAELLEHPFISSSCS